MIFGNKKPNRKIGLFILLFLFFGTEPDNLVKYFMQLG
jgi:hypothetical protein